MVYKVYSGRAGGVFGDLITVEIDASTGLPGLEVIGLPGCEIREAKDRVRIALKNCGITLPSMRVVINLSPADEHKEGAGFDLPIAVALLGVFGHIPAFEPRDTLVLGELSLDGKITGVRGVLPMVRMAREKGFNRVILPAANRMEGALIRGIDIIPVENLSEVITLLMLERADANNYISPFRRDEIDFETGDCREDFSEVYGQESVKRAAAVAAAGFHHFLMIGPPGTGKSLIARRVPGIMPRLTYEESLEVTSIYSVAGKLDENMPFVKERPFWSPHHGASAQAIVGGGSGARPGLVSLSHRGILFLDELAEFKPDTIDCLRQPLEEGKITVSRARQTFIYPARFMLVGASNPCPCGYYPDRNRCSCTASSIEKYMSRISGPIKDRIDICVEVTRMDLSTLKAGMGGGLSSRELREKVERAVAVQKKRYANENFSFNSELPTSKIGEYIPLSDDAQEFVDSIYEETDLSMRSYYKLIRVARSIADLDGDAEVEIKHLAESSCYRFPDYPDK